MLYSFTSIEARTAKALKPCAGGVVVCGQQGMNPANANAAIVIDPRHGGPAS